MLFNGRVGKKKIIYKRFLRPETERLMEERS